MGALQNFRRQWRLDRRSLVSRLPRRLQYLLHYRSKFKTACWRVRPRTFNEKLLYKLIYDHRPLLATLADKWLAREYVRRKIGDEVLVNLHLTTDRPEAIRLDQLPTRFVLKTNHGSGYVRIVKNKHQENEADLQRTCRHWLSQNYGRLTGEWAYQSIAPRIMVEDFLDAGNGREPDDYKLFVFNGKVFLIQVDTDRFTDHRRDLFSTDWQRFEVRYHHPNIGRPIPRPAGLERMLEIAECLGAEIDFVRVDLYEVGGRVYFGELTHFPENAGGRFDPAAFDALLGAQWQIQGY